MSTSVLVAYETPYSSTQEVADAIAAALRECGLVVDIERLREVRTLNDYRAIVLYGMQQMAAAGMKFATVAHFGQNEAARALYQACGFKPWHMLDGYLKHFELD